MNRALSVWWDEKIVGTLRIDEHGEMTFQYTEEWLADSSQRPLSISLPKKPEPFKRRECRPFFGGLLPEEGQLEAVARNLGISKANDFKLLEALGGDVAGALTVWPEGDHPAAPESPAQPTPLNDDRVAELLDALPKRPLLAGQDGLRLSLAGAQSKLPVVLADGQIALPAPGQPTTHILKPPLTHFRATTENEALMMRLAAALNLSVAAVQARSASGKPYLLIERYDRHVESGVVRRLHQEDFCQALGIPPERKYQAEGGPTFRHSFDLLRRAATRPAIEILKLLDAAIFNVIIGNADAHGKNFSLLYQGPSVTLAPLYDLVCTVAYEDLSPRFAMKIAKCETLEEIGTDAWPAFASHAGLAAPYVRRRVKELTESARDAVGGVAEGLAEEGLDRESLRNFASMVERRAVRLADTA
jgi:serine/threonine-protein kinase HipA